MNENRAVNTTKHTKSYILILVALVLLTLLSVGVSRLDIAVGVRVAVVLLIALVQGFLSLGFLMHLNWERRFIYGVLLLTVVFFAVLILLPTLAHLDSVEHVHVP